MKHKPKGGPHEPVLLGVARRSEPWPIPGHLCLVPLCPHHEGSLTMHRGAMVQLRQTKDAVAARNLVATVPQALHGLLPQRPKGTSCNLVSAGRFHFCRFVRGSNRILPRPNKKNDGRPSPQKRLTAPGLDRVRQGDATPGLRISLERQLGESVVSLGSVRTRYSVSSQHSFHKIPGRRSEYQNPLMGESNLERN